MGISALIHACITHGGPGPAGYRFILRFAFTGGHGRFIVVANITIVTLVR
jgi:hypothetical protein